MITNINDFRKINETLCNAIAPLCVRLCNVYMENIEQGKSHLEALQITAELNKLNITIVEKELREFRPELFNEDLNLFNDNSSINQPTTLEEAIEKVMSQSKEEYVAGWKKQYIEINNGVDDFDQEHNCETIDRAYNEFIHDCQSILNDITNFKEGCKTEDMIQTLIKDPNKLSSAIVAYSNNGDPLEFLKENKIILERNSTIAIPGVTTTEQLIAHIMQGIQKAMDIFTAQQKMPKISISVKGEYLHGLSETFKEDELGVFKHGVKHAQIQISNVSKLNIDESGMIKQIIWGTFSLRYEVLSGGNNGVPYMYSNNDDQFMYDIKTNKFFTRKDFFSSLPEKRKTGYNTKRVK